MSDKPKPGRTAATPATPATSEAPGDAWGQPISAERRAEILASLDQWAVETDHGGREGPFDHRDKPRWERFRLTGADVSWLAEYSKHDPITMIPDLHLEGADLRQAHLEGADLTGAHLEGADLYEARLDGITLALAHLERANLWRAHLERADLRVAQLEGANLDEAQLEGADLEAAHLEGANLEAVHLEGASLEAAFLDAKTVLNGAVFDARTRLGDVQWGGVGAVNLTQIDWRAVPRLGDERGMTLRSPVLAHERAVRAYRQLAAQLRAQGLSEVADRFAERAQVRQRKLLFHQLLADWRRPWRLPSDLLRWIFSWFLVLLAGYGYHPGRSVFWYLATISGFAYAYYKTTSGWTPFGLPHPSSFAPLTWYEALVLSVSSFHGRGFLPFPNLGDPVTILAAIEAVFGLLIEISFIATFTQRFFGSR